jgi:8-oxo-dGTP pyrophosphatase MutT (NUDIX family)
MVVTSQKLRRVVKVVLIDSNQRALILWKVERNRRPESPDGSDVPGGKVEEWEDDPRTAAVREVWEETGFRVSEDSLELLLELELTNRSIVLYYYVARCPDGKVKLNPDEHLSYHRQDVNKPANLTPTGWLEDLIRLGAQKLDQQLTA